MRRIPSLLAVGALLVLGACAQTTRWEKPQATEEATAADLRDCRVQAEREAYRTVGPYPYSYPLFYGYPFLRDWRYEYEARLRQEQYFAQNRLTSFCMQNKGYERVVVETPKQ